MWIYPGKKPNEKEKQQNAVENSINIGAYSNCGAIFATATSYKNMTEWDEAFGKSN